MRRGTLKAPSMPEPLVLRAAPGNGKHSLLTFPLSWQETDDGLYREVGSLASCLHYVTGKNTPVVSVSRIHSARNKGLQTSLLSTEHHQSVNRSSLLCCFPGESEAVLPEDTHLLLSSADTFKPLALMCKGKSGKRYTAPINTTNNTISASRN